MASSPDTLVRQGYRRGRFRTLHRRQRLDSSLQQYHILLGRAMQAEQQQQQQSRSKGPSVDSSPRPAFPFSPIDVPVMGAKHGPWIDGFILHVETKSRQLIARLRQIKTGPSSTSSSSIHGGVERTVGVSEGTVASFVGHDLFNDPAPAAARASPPSTSSSSSARAFDIVSTSSTSGHASGAAAVMKDGHTDSGSGYVSTSNWPTPSGSTATSPIEYRLNGSDSNVLSTWLSPSHFSAAAPMLGCGYSDNNNAISTSLTPSHSIITPTTVGYGCIDSSRDNNNVVSTLNWPAPSHITDAAMAFGSTNDMTSQTGRSDRSINSSRNNNVVVTTLPTTSFPTPVALPADITKDTTSRPGQNSTSADIVLCECPPPTSHQSRHFNTSAEYAGAQGGNHNHPPAGLGTPFDSAPNSTTTTMTTDPAYAMDLLLPNMDFSHTGPEFQKAVEDFCRAPADDLDAAVDFCHAVPLESCNASNHLSNAPGNFSSAPNDFPSAPHSVFPNVAGPLRNDASGMSIDTTNLSGYTSAASTNDGSDASSTTSTTSSCSPHALAAPSNHNMIDISTHAAPHGKHTTNEAPGLYSSSSSSSSNITAHRWTGNQYSTHPETVPPAMAPRNSFFLGAGDPIPHPGPNPRGPCPLRRF